MNESPTPSPGQDSWLAELYRKRWMRVVMLVLAIPTVLALVLGVYLWQRFGSDRAVEYTDVEEHFKYGSTGGEHVSGFPYWIFQAMPQVCAQHLPGQGYASLGLIYEEGHDLPIGMSKRHYQGIDQTFLNCAVCHASTVRDAATSKPRVYLGMPAQHFDIMGFEKFLFACAKDPKFSAEFVVPEARRLARANGQDLDLLDRYLVYPVAVALMRERLLMLAGRFDFVYETPDWGPGRVDTFNAAKVLFNFPMRDLPAHEKNGPADFPSIWLQGPRKGMQLHWDGNNTMVEERNKSAAFGTGTTPPTLDAAAVGRDRNVAADEGAAEVSVPDRRGQGGARWRALQGILRRLPRRLGTRFLGRIRRQGDGAPDDRHRPPPARLVLLRSRGQPVDALRRLSVALCALPQDVRLRQHAPRRHLAARDRILHNGSVPTLRDLLEPATKRPPRVLPRL